MLRIKVFTYCSDFKNAIKIKDQKSKSNFSNNNNGKNASELKVLGDTAKQNKIIEFS